MKTEGNPVLKENLILEENLVIEDSSKMHPETDESPSVEKRLEKQRNYSRRDYALIPIMVIAAFIYIRGASFFPGAWLPLFVAVFVDAGFFCLPSDKRRMGREGRIYLVFLAVAGLWYLVKYLPGQQDWEQQEIMPYMTLFLHGIGVYWLLTISESRLRGVLDESLICDLGIGVSAIPLKSSGKIISVALDWVKQFQNSDRKTKRKKRKAGQILFGILMSIPVLVIVLPLLAAADDSFSAFISGFFDLCRNLTSSFFNSLLFDDFWLNIVAVLAACYFYGLFYGSFHEKNTKHKIWINRKSSVNTLPDAIMVSFSAAVCGVYALFFLVKFSDILVKAFAMRQGYEYSEYARQGFFELCFIAVINFCLFYFIKICTGKQNKAVKIMLSLLCTETLGFIVLAFSKMFLYINGYGFTFKRVFTSWFMAVLFIAFARLFYCLWKQGNAIRTAVLFGSVTFLLLAFSNMDAWIWQANLALGFLQQ